MRRKLYEHQHAQNVLQRHETDGRRIRHHIGVRIPRHAGTLVDFDNASWNSSQQAYPTWEPDVLYKQGDKVIWNGNIYESLGNNENEQPDSAEEGTNAPWRIIGPVL